MDMTIKQAGAIASAVVSQATGKATPAPLTTADFVSVGEIALKTAADPLLSAISQILTSTIFSIRPYHRKFKDLNVSNQKFGNHVRKLSISDKDFEDDERQGLVDGNSVDMQKVNKPIVNQLNFYGQNTYQRHYTIFRDQLDTAFTSPAEFSAFCTMVVTNCSDIIEHCHESFARAALVNLLSGKIAIGGESVIKLLTEYNARTGKTLTDVTVYAPENYADFMRFAYARMAQVAGLMSERSTTYHVNITNNEVSRHTDMSNLTAFIYGGELAQIGTNVLATTFHEEYMPKIATETVNFWQNIRAPRSISNTPTILLPNGNIKKVDKVETDKVLAALVDREAVGYTSINQWTAQAPFNAAGGYTNTYFHFTDRYWNDFTENCVVFTME